MWNKSSQQLSSGSHENTNKNQTNTNRSRKLRYAGSFTRSLLFSLVFAPIFISYFERFFYSPFRFACHSELLANGNKNKWNKIVQLNIYTNVKTGKRRKRQKQQEQNHSCAFVPSFFESSACLLFASFSIDSTSHHQTKKK